MARTTDPTTTRSPLPARGYAGRWRTSLPRNVLAAGLVSFFTDVTSELIVSVLPIFLTAVLGAPVAAVGLIEGVAESTASILRVFAGSISDRSGRRKPLMLIGDGLAAGAGHPLRRSLRQKAPVVRRATR